jgi:hypothetical protein
VLFAVRLVEAYGVLTHEAIIDSAWDEKLRPLLLARFPGTPEADLKEAHAHAYGGCIIQDMGYYPFASKIFSDFTHYVRTGRFLENMIREARTVNELAFALGSLAHYSADNTGHPIVNRAVAMMYPKLRAKYGDAPTYEDNPTAHMKIEFAFDVLQVARGFYAPDAYHDFIGFKVSKELLERTFEATYGVEMKDIFASVDLALGTYRKAVSSVLPSMTKAAWNLKKDEIVALKPGYTKQKFLYNISKASYRKEWGDKYEKPGIFAKFLSLLFRLVPRVGPFKPFSYIPPTPEVEKMFAASFNATLDRYKVLLADVQSGRLHLEDENFDLGRPTLAGDYALADRAYSRLLVKLDEKNFKNLPPGLRADILKFYENPDRPNTTKKNRKEWQKTLAALDHLRNLNDAAALKPIP